MAPENRLLYITRSKHIHSGSYIGETYIEKVLAANGFQIIYPENVPVRAMVDLLRNAEVSIFSEGSAVHNLELCGRTGSKIFVIGRRRGTLERFKTILEDCSSAYRVYDSMTELGSLQWNERSRSAATSKSLSLVDISDLIANISEFCELELKMPEMDISRDFMMSDLGRYLIDTRSTNSAATSDEQLGFLLRQMQRKFAGWLTK